MRPGNVQHAILDLACRILFALARVRARYNPSFPLSALGVHHVQGTGVMLTCLGECRDSAQYPSGQGQLKNFFSIRPFFLRNE